MRTPPRRASSSVLERKPDEKKLTFPNALSPPLLPIPRPQRRRRFLEQACKLFDRLEGVDDHRSRRRRSVEHARLRHPLGRPERAQHLPRSALGAGARLEPDARRQSCVLGQQVCVPAQPGSARVRPAPFKICVHGPSLTPPLSPLPLCPRQTLRREPRRFRWQRCHGPDGAERHQGVGGRGARLQPRGAELLALHSDGLEGEQAARLLPSFVPGRLDLRRSVRRQQRASLLVLSSNTASSRCSRLLSSLSQFLVCEYDPPVRPSAHRAPTKCSSLTLLADPTGQRRASSASPPLAARLECS